MEWESQDDGYVAKWLVDQGAKDVAVGTPVLVMVDNKVWKCVCICQNVCV